MFYVDLDTMEICSAVFLLRKHGKAKVAGVPLSAEDLIDMNAAILDEAATGDVATGKAVLDGDIYQREYRNKTTEEFEAREREWRNAQYAVVVEEIDRIQDGHNSGRGLIGLWRAYRNALRDYPQGAGFPDANLNPRPVEPGR